MGLRPNSPFTEFRIKVTGLNLRSALMFNAQNTFSSLTDIQKAKEL